MDTRADRALKSFFPKFSHELRDFQRKVINHVFEVGSTVAIMPTGSGKSLIYWVAGKGLGGITLVVSPLIALIEEQSAKLAEQGLSTLKLHANLGTKQQIDFMTSLYEGASNPDFIFASPEKIATDGFFEFCLKKRRHDIKLIVIDEIHCVSQWGYDFRPFYKRIPQFLNIVFGSNWPPILGLTATLNPKELDEIVADFKIHRKQVMLSEDRLRFDVELRAEKFVKEDEKEERLWELLRSHRNDKVIVYLYRKYRKRGVDDLAEKAKEEGFPSLSFHGDLAGSERLEIVEQFKTGEIQVLFATNAFGMGMDIPDIRVVIHFMVPESVEQYYQEIGRAGRDGNGAVAYLLYTNKNIDVRRRHFIDKSFPDLEKIQAIFQKISGNEAALKTLQYFHDEEIQDALPYFLNLHLIEIKAKGFTRLNVFKSVSDPEVESLLNTTKTGMAIPTIKKSDLTPGEIFDILYAAIAERRADLIKMDKCLLVDCKAADLSEEVLKVISREVEVKKTYKHDLLDYLTYLLDNYEDSQMLHQEIGRYLGVPKFQLGKIYETRRGEWVRSKSEVIIANLLHQEGIDYRYEEKLFYAANKFLVPDFTFTIDKQTWYWEHLGMLGEVSYDNRWKDKKTVYENLNIDTLITTEERSNLSAIVLKKLNDIFR